MNLIPWRNKKTDRNADLATGRDLDRLRTGLDTLFDRFVDDPWRWMSDSPLLTLRDMAIDLSDSDNDVTVTADLPGIDPAKLDIRVEGNLLTIEAEKRQQTKDKRPNACYSERRYGRISRSIQLPSAVDPDKVEAVYTDGVLKIVVAKRPDARPRKIRVKQG